ncbi:MAG: hypothetical protein BZY88_14485, partial [SAR202 cluster bacterium Io17-Chloro-G9]
NHHIAYAPLVIDNQTAAVFGVALTTEATGQFIDRLTTVILAIAGVVAMLAGLICYVAAKKFTGPILRLKDAALAIGRGEFDRVPNINSGGEIGVLADAFNQMADQLLETNRLLEEGRNALESRVLERTRELEGANQKLVDAQEQLVKSAKLAAISQLSGGIAHDLRNPLGAIKNATYILNRTMSADATINSNTKLKRNLDLIGAQVDRAERTIGNLMAYAGVNRLDGEPTDLNDLIQDCLSSFVDKDGVEIAQHLDFAMPKVLCNSDQIHRIFSNLTTNAIEAMPHGGRLTVRTRTESGFARVAFSDNGTGISDADLGKIFDPLFTSKVSGTGFGLAVCQEIIDAHGGTIDVTNNDDGGTTFTVNFPLPE